MKKRPGKKITIDPMRQAPVDKGFNACHDAHTEWLPSVDELTEIIMNPPFVKINQPIEIPLWTVNNSRELATAIRKRLT